MNQTLALPRPFSAAAAECNVMVRPLTLREFKHKVTEFHRCITANYTNIPRMLDVYREILDGYMASIDMRDLVTTDLRNRSGDKCRRVKRSEFWEIVGFMSDKIDYVCENIERQRTKAEVRHRTRGEWEAIEREYVGTKPIPWEGYRVCGAWKCHNTYRVINGRSSMYCSVVCTNEQKAARLRLKNNGTLLPVKDYEAYRSAYVDKLRNHTEVSIRAAAGLATDNRDYRNRPKKKHNDIRTGADKVRKEPGELVCFNMRDVEHTVDWAGRYRFGNEWHSASAQFLGIIL